MFRAVSFYNFRLLSPVVQLYWVFRHGTFLVSRWENEGGVNLYHCGGDGRGFFVEVGVEQEKPVVLRSFVSAEPLADYTHGVRLPLR